jgi:sugar phosphate isomerase/epimerase
VLLLENEQITFAETIAHTLRFFDEIGNSPAIKLNLDPGNFFSAHEPVTPDAYEPFYQRELVAHIHVKDPKFRIPFAGSFFDVVGEGKINYKALFQQAIEHNYTGLFSLETHAPRNKEKISTKSLKNLTEMLTKL